MAITRRRPRWSETVLVAALAVVVVAPSTTFVRALLRPDPSAYVFEEDAYYSFEVAHRLAHGEGVTADGKHDTSGFQPLWTFALAAPFLFSDRVAIGLVGGASILLWLLAAWAFSGLLAELVPPSPLSRGDTRLLFAVVFLADGTLRTHFWNGLETGLYLTLLLVVVWRFVVRRDKAPGGDVLFGVALGLIALARSDGIAFAALIAGARIAVQPQLRRPRHLFIPIGIAVACLLPWVAYNIVVTGSPLPQSAAATSGTAFYPPPPLHDRLDAAGTTLRLLVWWPPQANGSGLSPATGAAVALAVVAGELALLRRSGMATDRRQRAALLSVVACAIAVTAAYVVVTAALWFLPRYSAPLKICLLGLTALALWSLASRVTNAAQGASRPLVATAFVGGVALFALIPVVALVKRTPSLAPGYNADAVVSLRQHRELARCAPIGMFESGRAGYAFPNRVVNLDGKVNVAALDAMRHHHLDRYLRGANIDLLYMRPRLIDPPLTRQLPHWTREFSMHQDPYADWVFLVRTDSVCAGATSWDG